MIDWTSFLKILLALLRILGQLPAAVDNRPVLEGIAEAVDLQANGKSPPA